MKYPIVDEGHLYKGAGLWPGLPLNDAFLFGDSIFTSSSTVNRRLPWWADHRQRLLDGWKWRCGTEIAGIDRRLDEHLQILNNALVEDLVVRIALYCIGAELSPRILITTRPLPKDRSMRLKMATIPSPRISLPNFVKCGNYLLARREVGKAKSCGFDDVVFVSAEGYILEASTSNIFLVKDGIVKTPSTDMPMLEGLARKHLIEFYRANGITVKEKTLTWVDLCEADEVFLTNAVRVTNVLTDLALDEGPMYLKAREMMRSRQ